MALRGIGGSGYDYGLYNYQSSVNQVRLQQALNKYSSGSKKNSTTSVNDTLKNSSTDFLKSYNSSMSDLMSAANSLKETNTAGVWSDVSAVSSNTDIMTAAKNYKLSGTDSYEISVQQLATAQTNVSAAAETNAAATADASMKVATNKGDFNVYVNATDNNGAQKTNGQMMQDIAKQINDAKLNVTASVVEKDGKSSLKLTSNDTGTSNAFLASGDYADKAGLTNAEQKAQDAQYSVKINGGTAQYHTSGSNKVDLEFGKITATLKQTGTATIGKAANENKVISSVEDLVNSYNDAMKVLSNNAERGTGVTRQLKAMAMPPAAEKSMKLVGITMNKDGTLALNKDTLAKSLKEDMSLTKDIIGGSFGVAQGAYNDAKKGLSTPSNSLINNDIQTMKQNYETSDSKAMSMFANSGAYNVMNYYAVGMMVNYLA